MKTSDEELRDRLIQWTLVLLFIIGTMPYLLGYVILALGFGAGLGYLFYRGCRIGFGRHYGNVALYIPATVTITLLVLSAVEPDTSFTRVGGLLHPGNLRRSDQWRDAFNWVYHTWYGHLPIVSWFVSAKSQTSYDFRHFYWVIVSGVFFLAPAAFWILYTRETIEREERKRLALNHVRQEKNSELESLAERFAKEKEKLLAAIRARDAEIERLRIREKYLTHGKPKSIGDRLETIDLDHL